jgi:hypothetical protein
VLQQAAATRAAHQAAAAPDASACAARLALQLLAAPGPSLASLLSGVPGEAVLRSGPKSSLAPYASAAAPPDSAPQLPLWDGARVAAAFGVTPGVPCELPEVRRAAQQRRAVPAFNQRTGAARAAARVCRAAAGGRVLTRAPRARRLTERRCC